MLTSLVSLIILDKRRTWKLVQHLEHLQDSMLILATNNVTDFGLSISTAIEFDQTVYKQVLAIY